MGEDFDQYETITIEQLGYITWSLGIFAGLLSFIAQYLGLRIGTTNDGFAMLWWGGAANLMFAGSTILWALCIAYYFRKYSQELNRVAGNIVALISLLTAVFWIASYVLRIQISLLPYDETAAGYPQVLMFLGLGGITLGLSLVGSGLMYMTRRKGSIVVSVLTGIVFILTGAYGILVGVGSGLSSFPMFTVYDIPWIAVIAIASSVMGIVVNLNQSREQD